MNKILIRNEGLVHHTEQRIWRTGQNHIQAEKLKGECNLPNSQMKNQKCHLMLAKQKRHKLLLANTITKISNFQAIVKTYTLALETELKTTTIATGAKK